MIRKCFSYIGLFFLELFSRLPLSILYVLADLAYVFLYHITGYRKKVVRENLTHALPDKTPAEIIRIEKQYFKYLASLIFEILKTNSISEKELQKRFVYKNKAVVLDYLERGEGVLICSAHYGNWEWGTLALALNFPGIHYPIYKPLNNPIFDEWFKKMRSRFGNHMVPMRQTMRALASSRGQASTICFGSDQSPTVEESHYWTTFLHQPASIQLGVEKIARKTNRPVIYLKVRVLKRGYYEVDCVPLCLNPAETQPYEITEMHTRLLEEIIREEPAYWLWSHKRWKNKPKP